MLDGKLQRDKNGRKVMVEAEALKELAERVFEIGCHFMLYCHNIGIDPIPHIQRMLDEMRIPIPMEAFQDEYEQSIKEGVEIRIDLSEEEE